MVPKGLVALWSGNAATIPAGWALCDGTVGTPDLRDRFVVGAGSTYVVGDTGGATNHTHSTDIDPVTSSTAGAHTHTVDVASTTSSTSATHTHDVNPASATTSSDAHTHTGGTLTFSREVSVPASPNGTGGFYFSLTTGTQSTGIDPVWGGATGSDSHSHTVDVANTTSTASGAHSHTVDPAAVISDSQGAHSHAVDPPATTSTASDSRPPYYALCYIMKL
jgi:hypothetical protein